MHKTNVLTFAGKLWSRIVAEVGEEFPDVEVAYQHIDAATIHMVTDPGRFDVIVTDNLFGDIITDLAAAVSGGIGLAASGNIDATRTNPSMFEPVHGSAPDIAGQGIADPTAAIMSVALLLAHVGEDAAAARVDKAVEQHLATRGDEKLSTSRGRRADRREPVGRPGGDAAQAVLVVRDRLDVLRNRHPARDVGDDRRRSVSEPVVLHRVLVLHNRGVDAVGAGAPCAGGRLVLRGNTIRRNHPVQHQHGVGAVGACGQAGTAPGVGARHVRVDCVPRQRRTRRSWR